MVWIIIFAVLGLGIWSSMGTGSGVPITIALLIACCLVVFELLTPRK